MQQSSLLVAASVIGAVTLSACATFGQENGEVLSIADVWQRHDELDGRIVRVRGIAQHCYSLGCAIEDGIGSSSRSLQLGGSIAFDRRMNRYTGRWIVVQGRLDATCMHFIHMCDGEDVMICTDRATMLQYPQIISISR